MTTEGLPDDPELEAALLRYVQRKRALLDDYLTREEVAAELRVSVSTMQRYETERRGPPCFLLGKRTLYSRDGVKRWLQAKADEKAQAFNRGRTN